MIHLFDRFYLEVDDKIDIHSNRYVISNRVGSEIWEKVKEIQRGKLYGFQKDIEVEDVVLVIASTFFNVPNRSDKIVFYVDHETVPKFLAAWSRFLFPNIDENEAINFYKSYIVYYNIYNQYYDNPWSVMNLALPLEVEKFKEYFLKVKGIKETDSVKYFKEMILEKISMEFKIATFLYNEGMFENIVNDLNKFMVKEIENQLIESREGFYSLFLKKSFQERVGLSKEYTLSNIEEIFTESSESVAFLFDKRIWKSDYLSNATSSGGNINIENITAQDLEHMENYWDVLWNLKGLTEDSDFTVQNNLLYIKDYILNVQNGFTKESLKEFLMKEYQKINALSVLNSSLIPTVNSYILDHILTNSNNQEILKKYSLVK